MEKQNPNQRTVSRTPLSRRARLQALLFAGATLGAALLMTGVENPKIPLGLGE